MISAKFQYFRQLQKLQIYSYFLKNITANINIRQAQKNRFGQDILKYRKMFSIIGALGPHCPKKRALG